MHLSKSQYIRGLQCVKSLWLKKYKPDVLQQPDETTKTVFETGSLVGHYACELFPDGEEIPFHGTTFSDKIQLTQEHIDNGVDTIYEATFSYDGILVMVDILHRTPSGWQIFEVKSATTLHEVYIDDAAIQYYVVRGCGLIVDKVKIVHLNSQYIRGSGEKPEPDKLFIQKDITDTVMHLQPNIKGYLATFTACVTDTTNEPDIDIGAHCTKPYTCDGYEYCWRKQKNIPAYSVFNIFTMGQKALELYKQGIVNVEDIPENCLTTEKQKFVVDAYKTNKTIINTDAIKEFLDDLSYPISYLDFETFQQAIPEIPGTRPYQQIPFQFSLHVEDVEGRLEHIEFLAEEYGDPREDLIQKLITAIPCNGTILVYNQSFEKTRIKELIRDFPKYTNELISINDRIVDLALPFSQKHYYDPAFNGKYSIKIVMPVLVQEMAEAYKKLELIQHGGDAMSIFPRLKLMSREQKDRYRYALLKYCELDTLSMVKITKKLRVLIV